MVSVASLWLPIVVATVAVFVLSSVLHMVLTYHRNDYRKLPNETEVMASLRLARLTPGLYHFPWATTPKEMSTPEMVAKLNEGPVGLMSVMPNGPMKMGKYLGVWAGYCLLVNVLVAVVARTMAPGTDRLLIGCITSTAAFLGHGSSNIVDSIWKGYPWGVTAKHVLDGLIYSLATGAVFAWLWPA